MNIYFKLIVAGVTALALAGCVTDQTATTISTDVGSLVTDIGSIISASTVLTHAQILAIQSKVSEACNFVPAEQTVLDIAGLFNSAVATGSADVTPLITSICNQAKATSSTLSVSRLNAHKQVTIGTFRGVPIKGYYTK